ncbi:MAG: hypothetical protein M3198_15420, partial [Actinomycetota bacterium]|nr:hypothetical protein [Actinomycetota bacterium]
MVEQQRKFLFVGKPTIVGALLLVLGLPGYIDDFRAWRGWVRVMNLDPGLVLPFLTVAGFAIILFANVRPLRFWQRPHGGVTVDDVRPDGLPIFPQSVLDELSPTPRDYLGYHEDEKAAEEANAVDDVPVTDITPQYLSGLYRKGLSTAKVKRAAAGLIGIRIPVEGRLYDLDDDAVLPDQE